MPRTLAQNAQYIAETIKPAIKSAIEAQGVTVPSTDNFLDYADRIGEIEGGGSGYQLKDLPTGAISTVTDAAELPLNALKVSVKAWQEGSGDPSPSNIRPIHGWDSGEISVKGKNLCPVTEGDFLAVATWVSLSNENANTFTNGTVLKLKAGTYTLSLSNTQNMNTLQIFDESGDAIVNTSSALVTFTLNSAKTLYIRLRRYSGSANLVFKIQIELGNQATTYEPYQGKQYTQQFPTTVHGAEWDVVNGELKQTDGYIASYNGETLPSTWISDRDVYASGTTPTTGAEVVYKLATPTTIQLSPLSIRLNEGTNNVYADCGDVIEGEYFVDEGAHRYQLYDYIESDGTQVIDLGFAPKNGDEITVDNMMLSEQSSSAWIWGATDPSTFIGVVQNTGNKSVYSNSGGGSTISYIRNQLNTDTIMANRDYAAPLCMFGFKLNGSYAPGITTRIYLVKVNDNFYLPAKRKSDGVFGLYDMANQAFLTDSAGGNAFAGGNPIGVEV